jgi:hypothetical protein
MGALEERREISKIVKRGENEARVVLNLSKFRTDEPIGFELSDEGIMTHIAVSRVTCMIQVAACAKRLGINQVSADRGLGIQTLTVILEPPDNATTRD